MKTTIIVPVYNEEKTIAIVIEKIKKLNIEKEILVVDDGSKDNSYKKISEIEGIRKFRHSENRGKGAAVKTGIKNSSGEVIIVQDADLELDPSQILDVIKPILEKKAYVVYGSRNLSKPDPNRSPLFYLGGRLITLVTNLIYGTNLTDEPCGYKAFSADIIKKIKIKENRFEWEPEITAKICKRKIPIFEVPVVANSRSSKEGKKLRRRDGVKAIFALIKYKFFK